MTSIPSEAATVRTAVLVLLAGTLVRLALAALLDPGVDEAYAMAVAKQWQLSWFDHPPMAFWWVKGMHDLAAPLFGEPLPTFVLRLPFVLAFTVTSAVMFDLTRRLWGARAGLWTLVALTLAPFFLVSAGSWMVPDGPLLLFLALTARVLAEILFFSPAPERTRERRLWIVSGVTLGLAALSKYHAALFALGCLAFLLVTPYRARLVSSSPWLGVAIASLIASPVLVWNADHEWVSFLFQSSRGIGSEEINWSGFVRALLGQAAYLAPWTLVGAVIATVSLLRSDRTIAGPTGFLASLALPSVILFTAVPLWGGAALPHWQMPGWLFLLPFLGRAIAESEASGRTAYRRARGFAIAGTAVLALAIGMVAALRVMPPSLDAVRRLGIGSFLEESVSWRGLAAGLAERRLLAGELPWAAQQSRPLVVAFRWIDAARVAEALGSRATVAVFGNDPRGFAFYADPADWLGRDVLMIGRPKTFDRGLEATRSLFSRIDLLTPIAVKIGGFTVFEAQVAIGRNMTSAYPLPYPHR